MSKALAALVNKCREGKGNFPAKVSKAWLVWFMHGEGKGTFRPKVSKAWLLFHMGEGKGNFWQKMSKAWLV